MTSPDAPTTLERIETAHRIKELLGKEIRSSDVDRLKEAFKGLVSTAFYCAGIDYSIEKGEAIISPSVEEFTEKATEIVENIIGELRKEATRCKIFVTRTKGVLDKITPFPEA